MTTESSNPASFPRSLGIDLATAKHTRSSIAHPIFIFVPKPFFLYNRQRESGMKKMFREKKKKKKNTTKCSGALNGPRRFDLIEDEDAAPMLASKAHKIVHSKGQYPRALASI
jgi:hypothetical protein